MLRLDVADIVRCQSTTRRAFSVQRLLICFTVTSLVMGATVTCSRTLAEPQAPAIEVDTASNPDLRLGDSIKLAELAAAQGTSVAGAAWSSSDTAIITVDSRGSAQGVGVGPVMVRATTDGQLVWSKALYVGAANLVGAGDIGRCSTGNPRATADLLDSIPGHVFTAGDNVYEDGTAAEWANCYDPTWGRHKARTRPSIGNHDTYTDSGTAYYDYWGPAAGERGRGYYSYNIGPWHVVVINSMVDHSAGSEQELWLRRDLALHRSRCTLAYWHYPRFSSGREQHSDLGMQPMWQDLYGARADVVVSGHSHVYERFAPMSATGERDDTQGIREFVVGTGGASLLDFDTVEPNSEVRDNSTFGVIRFRLFRRHYEWAFIPIAGGQFRDAGVGACHPKP
jgi:hypothetical protein